MSSAASSPPIGVGFCVAYDWHLLQFSLPPIYAEADRIVLAVNRERLSFSGKPFEFDFEAFEALVRQLDPAGKVEVLAENFYDASRTPMGNETFQRQRIAETLGPHRWHVQLDCDEFFIDFAGFVARLRRISRRLGWIGQPLHVRSKWVPIAKEVPGGYLLGDLKGIDEETTPVAAYAGARVPQYAYARHLRKRFLLVKTPFLMLHQTLARTPEELATKLRTWGHQADITDADREGYLKLWAAVEATNYRYLRSFHPLNPDYYLPLVFSPAQSIAELRSLTPSQDTDPRLRRKYFWSNVTAVLRSLLQRLVER